ncbi:hypothetical protein ACFQZT_33925 [Paenibacillus sp. GCM10027628]|uniref:hypothetical protein n=1 Tax=Paenibacillus sp. GCM10027628 TaxID=3273413 RepID=UPI00363F4F7E
MSHSLAPKLSEKEIAEIVAEVIKTQNFQLNGPGNENKLEFAWWGYCIYLDYDNTNTLINALKTGSTIADIVALLLNLFPGVGTILGLLVGLVAILLQGFYIDAMIGCNEKGRGIVINNAWAGFTWISPQ